MHHLFLIIFICIGFSQGRLDGLVAIVGDHTILHSDVLQQSQIIAASKNINPTKRPYLFENIYIETLENMIDQYAVLGVAEKDTNLIITDNEVDRALDLRIDEFISQAGSIELFEEAVGVSLRQIKLDYWDEIRNMMFIERYKYSIIQYIDVSRVEVNSFYDSFKDSIPLVPENYTFSVVEVPFVSGKFSENIVYQFLDSLRNLIVTNDYSFDLIAKEHSEDPGSAFSGGNLGFTSRGTLVKDYEVAAYALSVGEISHPIRTQFGYHLIRLNARRGEEISTQHILRLVSFSNRDKEDAFNVARDIYKEANNDPFVFDSLATEYNNSYKNFSGVYSKITQKEIPQEFLDHIYNQTLFKLSHPFESGGGYLLIYLYEFNKSFLPDTINSWNLIYQYAKQEKQNRLFQKHIIKIKDKTYIKKFDL